MNILIDILALLGFNTLVAYLFRAAWWARKKREAKRLRSLPHWAEFQKISEWSGDHSLLARLLEQYKEGSIHFEVVYPLDHNLRKASIDDFNPSGFPAGIRPHEWFVHVFDGQTRSDLQTHTVVLCHRAEATKPNWTIKKSGRYWFNDQKAEITLEDRCGCTFEVTKERDVNSQLQWDDLIADAYQVIMHGNSVHHYRYIELENECKKKNG